MPRKNSEVKRTKEVIKSLTASLSKEINSIKKNVDRECIDQYENILSGDYKYYESLFFNEEKFAERIKNITGYFNYSELCEEIDDYIRVYVWYCGWLKWMDGEI